MNDEEVTKSGVDHVLSQSAYMLIYERDIHSNTEVKVPIISEVKIETPLNSTIPWIVENIAAVRGKHSLLNSTLGFRVIETLMVDNSVKALEVEDKKVDKKIEERQNHVKPLDYESEKNQQSHFMNHRKDSFLEELKKEEKSILSWNHVATSDKAFKKRLYLDELSTNEKLKRKRASKEDMEYDAPKRKGFKKLNQKQFF